MTRSYKDIMTDLVKIATELANGEKEALTKEAAMIGTALADAFMARVSSYEKIASTEEVWTEEKIASMCEKDPEFAAAFAQGYNDKIAEELAKNPAAAKAYTDAYEKTASVMIKIAEDVRTQGYVGTASVLAEFIK